MHNFPASLSTEFRHESSVRRATIMLDAKRQRLRADLKQFIHHLDLLVPTANGGPEEQPSILTDAADRLGDEAFAALVRQLLAEEHR